MQYFPVIRSPRQNIQSEAISLSGVDCSPLSAAGRDGVISEDKVDLFSENLATLYLRGSKMGLAVFHKLLSRPKHRQVKACRRRINCIAEPEEDIDGKNKQASVWGYIVDGTDDSRPGIGRGGINVS